MRRPILGLALFLTCVVTWAGVIETEPLPGLNRSVSNNAVALVNTPEGVYLYSFLGLGSGKTWQDISAGASVLSPGAKTWKDLAAVPGPGRLAASAVSVGGAAWLFGGYTVAADGSEESIPGVYRIRPGESGLQWITDMPVPVEDSVILTYLDRYIYLISGWHDLGNVNLVQVLDTRTLKWTQATPWPGVPVFGHSGGISGGQMLVCDGVKIQYFSTDKPRKFLPSDGCWLGNIDGDNHRRINWQSVSRHPGAARYRMAATGVVVNGSGDKYVVFAGGSDNPYNFNGIGYDGVPAKTEKSVFSFNFKSSKWQRHGALPQGSMDHRGLPHADGWFYLIGGMRGQQTPVTDVIRFKLEGLGER